MSRNRLCLELKSLKEYLQAYRDLGIFQENIVNQRAARCCALGQACVGGGEGRVSSARRNFDGGDRAVAA